MDLEEKEKAIQVLTNENADLKEEIEDLNDKLSRYSDYEYQSRTLESKNGNISSELSDCKDEFERYKA
jgi:cell division protein FtsB